MKLLLHCVLESDHTLEGVFYWWAYYNQNGRLQSNSPQLGKRKYCKCLETIAEEMNLSSDPVGVNRPYPCHAVQHVERHERNAKIVDGRVLGHSDTTSGLKQPLRRRTSGAIEPVRTNHILAMLNSLDKKGMNNLSISSRGVGGGVGLLVVVQSTWHMAHVTRS
jgi:hypothetical protein